METTEAKKNEQLQKTIAVVQTKFETLQQEVKDVAARCLQVKVTDAISLDLGRKIANNANDINKRIEETRVKLKAPYITLGKEIDRIAKEISTDIQKGIDHVKAQFAAWNKIQEDLARKEKAEAEKKKETLMKYDAQLKDKCNKCNTPEDCEKLAASIRKIFPAAEAFGPYGEESVRLKEGFLKYLEGKADKLKTGTQENAMEAKDEIAAVSQNIESKSEIIETITPEKSKTRKTVKFSIADEKLVDRTFLSVDESKIKQYATANKEMLSNKPFVFGGIEFWIEEIPILG